MKNLTCGAQQILLMVISLVLTSVETEQISFRKLGSCVSWTCFSGRGKCGRALNLHILFVGFLLGG